MKLKTFAIITLSFFLTANWISAANYKASREMYKLVSKIKKGSKTEALEAAKLLADIKIHDLVVENLLFEISVDPKTAPELRKQTLLAYAQQSRISKHETLAANNLSKYLGRFGKPDPVLAILMSLGPHTLPQLASQFRCPTKKQKKKKFVTDETGETHEIQEPDDESIYQGINPAELAQTINTLIKLDTKKKNLAKITKPIIKCMRCWNAKVASSCGKVAGNLPNLSIKNLKKLKRVLYLHKNIEVKTSAANAIAKQHKSNKIAKQILVKSMKNRRADIQLAATIAIYTHIDQTSKIRKKLEQFSKKRNKKLSNPAKIALKQAQKLTK